MMRTFLTITLLCLLAATVSGQGNVGQQPTKMEQFSSKTGVVLKFEDYNLDPLPLEYGAADIIIRKITSGNQVGYFLRIEHEGRYGLVSTSIAYEDLLEIKRALRSLIEEAGNDQYTSADYMENKFITDDGFSVGYYVDSEKTQWYITLKHLADGNSLFLRTAESFGGLLNVAINRIESAK